MFKVITGNCVGDWVTFVVLGFYSELDAVLGFVVVNREVVRIIKVKLPLQRSMHSITLRLKRASIGPPLQNLSAHTMRSNRTNHYIGAISISTLISQKVTATLKFEM